MKKLIAATILILIMMNNLFSQNFTALDSLFADYDKENSPGASLMLIRDNKIIYKKNYGLANLEDKIKVTSETNFRLASVTKQFTAASILLLIKMGKLNLNSAVTDVFTDFPVYGKKITIRNLLNHTSGLIDYEDLIPDSTSIQLKDKDVLLMMKQQDSTYFEPGTKFKYSNSAYALLAMMVETLTGRTFAEFLKENIFDPLEMKNTVAHEEGISTVSNRAFGYSFSNDEYLRTDQSITSAVLGDGGIYSNAEDLFKWIQSIETFQILPREMIVAAETRGALNSGEEIDYGFGWHLVKNEDIEIVYHTGSTIGFRNIIYRIPSKKFILILLTNRNKGNEKDTRQLAETVIKSLKL